MPELNNTCQTETEGCQLLDVCSDLIRLDENIQNLRVYCSESVDLVQVEGFDEPSSAGSVADKRAGVDISKVHGGYFSDKLVAQAFIEKGIAPLLEELPLSLKYVDFGGGQGFLTKFVRDHLHRNSYVVEAIVVDANPDYLKVAKQSNLRVLLSNIESSGLEGVDLATARAVNHYQDLEKQELLLKGILGSLKPGGFFVSQVSSGSSENCSLRSDIVNLESLGRAGQNRKYHWTSVEEYFNLLRKAGFTNIKIAGYAPNCSWTPEEQWDRFHKKETEVALALGDNDTLKRLTEQQELFIRESYQAIDKAVNLSIGEELGVIYEKGKAIIGYQYPIIIAQRPKFTDTSELIY